MGLRECLHHRQEFLSSVTLRPGELEKLLQSGNNCSTLWRTRNDDGSTSAQLQEPLVSEDTQGPQNGIGVDAKDGSEIPGLRNPISGVGFAISDGAADLGGDLIVERHGIGSVHP